MTPPMVPAVMAQADQAMILDPRTGEVIDLPSATLSQLGEWRDYVRDLEAALRIAKRVVDQEITARMDKRGKWTLHDGGYTLSAPSPEPRTEYDAPALREDLLSLVDHGDLEAEAVDNAVEVVVTYKPRAAGINALRKIGPHVREIVERHSHRVEPERRVQVKRS